MKQKITGMLVLCFLLIASLVLTADFGTNASAAATGNKPVASKTIKVANYYGETHPVNIALRDKFKMMVEKNSNGTLKVEIFDNGKIGSEEQFYDGVRSGTVQMAIHGIIMQNDVPKVKIVQLPFLFKDYAHAKRVLEGPIGADMIAELEPKLGLHFLGYDVNGFRVVSGSKPILKLSDFKGFRLRMPNYESMVDLGKALGASVTPMPMTEVFSALQQKVIDGQENPYATLRASGWYEVQKYVLETRHIFSPDIYVMNKKFWDTLTKEEQKVVAEAAKTTCDYEWELSEKGEVADKKFLQEKGIKVTVPDDKFRDDLITATQPIYDKFFKTYPWGKEIVDKIRAAVK